MATVLITGGTGLIGRALQKLLVSEGYQLIILTREPNKYADKKSASVRFAKWDVKEQTIDKAAVADADHIIHLAGEGVADKRWTAKRKKEIVNSRTESSKLIVDTLRSAPNKVRSLISASAIGWYGEDPKIPNPDPFKEEVSSDPEFLGEACKLWEASIDPVSEMGIRLVKFRTGIVLSKDGGAFPELRRPVYFGVAGILSKGRQVYSWIHIDDMARMYLYALQNEELSGVYNAVAPKPVSNKELTIKLADILKRKFYVPVYVPSFVLKIALGQMSQEVLKSTTVCSDKIRKSGFDYTFPTIESALAELTQKSST